MRQSGILWALAWVLLPSLAAAAPQPSNAKMLEQLAARCDEGSGKACNDMGDSLYRSNGFEAVTYYIRGCRLKYAGSCSKAAAEFFKGKVVDRDLASAENYNNMGCFLKDEVSCKQNIQVFAARTAEQGAPVGEPLFTRDKCRIDAFGLDRVC